MAKEDKSQFLSHMQQLVGDVDKQKIIEENLKNILVHYSSKAKTCSSWGQHVNWHSLYDNYINNRVSMDKSKPTAQEGRGSQALALRFFIKKQHSKGNTKTERKIPEHKVNKSLK
nr:hypothetical protein CFP56_62079 [Quercus suber]